MFWENIGNFFKTIKTDFGYMAPHFASEEALSIVLVCMGFIATILIAYFLGSINFAIIISGKKYKEDIRDHGSKNAGMTNMMRTYGKKAAVLTLVGDALKAIVACFIGYVIMGSLGAYAAGLFCMIGHVFPIFYGFKGGKGVVTAAATVLMTDWLVFLILLALFILMVAIWRYISLASITCMLLYPLILSFTTKIFLQRISPFILFSVLMAALIIGKHWTNIQRLREGKESKFSFKKSVKTPTETSGENNEGEQK